MDKFTREIQSNGMPDCYGYYAEECVPCKTCHVRDNCSIMMPADDVGEETGF